MAILSSSPGIVCEMKQLSSNLQMATTHNMLSAIQRWCKACQGEGEWILHVSDPMLSHNKEPVQAIHSDVSRPI